MESRWGVSRYLSKPDKPDLSRGVKIGALRRRLQRGWSVGLPPVRLVLVEGAMMIALVRPLRVARLGAGEGNN